MSPKEARPTLMTRACPGRYCSWRISPQDCGGEADCCSVAVGKHAARHPQLRFLPRQSCSVPHTNPTKTRSGAGVSPIASGRSEWARRFPGYELTNAV